MLRSTMTVLAKSSTELRSESVRSLYDQLTARLKDLNHLNGISGLLQWDQEVMMPSKAAASRAEQLSTLAGVSHEMQTSSVLGSLLEELEQRQDLSAELNPYELANIRLSRKTYKEETLLPVELVKANAALNSKSVGAWVEARKESDFSKFAPFLQDQVNILRQKVSYKMKGGVCEEARKINEKARASLGLTEADECYKGYYQALLNDYEPGFKDDRLQALFSDLKQNLVPLIAKIKAKNFQHDNSYIEGDFDVKKQTEFSHRISKQIGFDTDAGRLDVSTHPFTGGAHPTDVRMTTRYTINNFQEGITGTIHETGHSLYEQGRNKEYVDTPVSQALSLGVHESQSLLWERMVALSKPFWTYTLPLLKEQFPDREDLQAVTPEQYYNAFNRVEPGFIRIEADEVTYPMHVILRYEIEKALVEGDIQVADVPDLWNAKMKEYLGLEVTEDRIGCLQDTHWAVGLIGYFPTYTLGSIYAVQIFATAKEAIPNLDEHLAKGEFPVLKEWLNKNVHEQGSLRESGDDLIFDLTGKHLDSSLYVKYLTDKYTAIYDL
ncbi:putative carboxypeptidase [Linnemannia elongata]|nr:putative carboxypeptidase [Linnemannia elongata]KAK5816153.1 putative carboxypeptidase [Linnemannia elongata]